MKKVVKCPPSEEEVKICTEDADEGKYYTLETKSGRPFFLIRANATVDDDTEEDQWHWVAIGKEKNRKTGFSSFEDAIEGALKKDRNTLKEHDTQSDVFTYLANVAEQFED